MRLIHSFRFAELPAFDAKPTICPCCGGEKFKMACQMERLRRPANEEQVRRLVMIHSCRACGWCKWTLTKESA